MVDIQPATAEIRRGKKDRINDSMKIYMAALLRRVAIKTAKSPLSSDIIKLKINA